jgi:hypothetical protein
MIPNALRICLNPAAIAGFLGLTSLLVAAPVEGSASVARSWESNS